MIPNAARLSQDPGNTGPDYSWDQFVASFNAELAVQLDIVQAQYSITIFRFDLLAIEDDMIANPGKYGLVNVAEPACPDCGVGLPAPGAGETIVPNPDQYLYWDGAHFTRVVHKIIGDVAADLVLGKN